MSSMIDAEKSQMTLTLGNANKKHAESTVKDLKKNREKHEQISMIEDMIQNASGIKTISLKNI